MTQSQNYLRNGHECVAMADKARFPQDRAQWLSLAQGWFQLANDADHGGLGSVTENIAKPQLSMGL
jgi:hypothetical protein